jgi:hypothetical protein
LTGSIHALIEGAVPPTSVDTAGTADYDHTDGKLLPEKSPLRRAFLRLKNKLCRSG